MSVLNRLGQLVTPSDTDRAHAAADLDVDAAFSLLASERRRLVVRYAIEDTEGVITLDEVVSYIAGVQYGPEYTSKERKRVYISLYQNHISELVDAGALKRVDSEGHTFRVREPAHALYDILDAATVQLGGDA